MIKKLKKFITNPQIRFGYLTKLGFYDNMSDEEFLKRKFKIMIGKDLDLENPQTFNEKLQWLKLYDRKPEYTTMVDKYAVKKYVAEKIGEEYIIPTLGVWDDPDEINFDALPNQFVLKCNHNSGTGMCICRDKSKLDIEKVKAELRKGLKEDYYLHGREWPYKDVPRKIICEEFLENNDKTPMVDYKFYCYGGKPVYFMYSVGEATGNVRNHKFNMDLESIDYLFKKNEALHLDEIKLPNNINEMINIVKILSKGHEHIRIDLYNINGSIKFGELTFFSNSGFINIYSKEFENELSNMINIERIRKNESNK